jgi:hypothetical protein
MAKKIDAYPTPTVCEYCGASVVFTSNEAVYGKKYGNGMCYKCTGCDSYVGVHSGTEIPLGRLANQEQRNLKVQCHALFDPLWKNNGPISRGQAYGWLADTLGIPHEECHFGWFDRITLRRCLRIFQDENWYVQASERQEMQTAA